MEAQEAVAFDSAEPSGAEASPADESYQGTEGQEGNESQGTEEVVREQQPSKSERRIQRLANEKRELEAWKTRYQDAANFHDTLRQQSPEGIQLMIQLAQDLLEKKRDVNQVRQALQKLQEAQAEDPYAEYDEPIRKLAAKNDQLTKELEDIKKWRDEATTKESTSYLNNLSTEFDRLLEKDGHITPEGEYDEVEYYAMSKLTRSLLDDYAKNPKQPTVQELNRAYKLVKQFLGRQGGKVLKNVTRRPSLPPSGSRKGAPVIGGATKKALSIDEMTNMLKD